MLGFPAGYRESIRPELIDVFHKERGDLLEQLPVNSPANVGRQVYLRSVDHLHACRRSEPGLDYRATFAAAGNIGREHRSAAAKGQQGSAPFRFRFAPATHCCQIPLWKNAEESAFLQLSQGSADTPDITTVPADSDTTTFLEQPAQQENVVELLSLEEMRRALASSNQESWIRGAWVIGDQNGWAGAR
jgi:hypothetical protein